MIFFSKNRKKNRWKKGRLPAQKQKKSRFVENFWKKKADYQGKNAFCSKFFEKKGRLPAQKKKSRFVQNFLKKKYFLKNSDFFTKDVLTPLLGGMKTISGIYHVVFVQ